MTASLFPTAPFDQSSPMHTASGKRMGKSGHNVGRVSPSNDRTFAEHVSSFLRRLHPVKTAQCVACDTGIPATTIRKWLEQGCAPSGKHTALLTRRYRGAFLYAVFPEGADEWFAELARQDDLVRLERQAATIRQQLSDVMRGWT